MEKIRVLVAEDSATVRNWLVESLGREPSIDVIGVAEDGRQAVEICRRRRPDVVTMDLAMPGMDGLAATEHIMAHCPTPILIVSASENRGEVFKAYGALAAGAVDILEKPSARADAAWERSFLDKIRTTARIRVITHPRARLAQFQHARAIAAEARETPASQRFSLVAIGASTGGPAAILRVLDKLPAAFDLPIIIALHVHPSFAGFFRDWLASQLVRPVVVFEDGMALSDATGGVVVAPGDGDLVLRDGRLHLLPYEAGGARATSIDVLFESIAESCGASAIACLLTGMGKDGAAGLLQISRAGGLTIAQDAATSVVYGMPRAAVSLGAAQRVLAIEEIGVSLAASWALCAEAAQ